MKFRLGALLVAVVAVFSASGLGAASASAASRPAASFASEATANQNKVIEGALARVPGGTRISASQARWPAAGFGLVVPASPAADPLQQCLNTVNLVVFCGFTKASWEGNWVYAYNTNSEGVPTEDIWVPWGGIEPGQGMHSWYNQTSTRVWREQFQNSGNELCINPWPTRNSIVSDYTGPDLYDYWFLLTTNENFC